MSVTETLRTRLEVPWNGVKPVAIRFVLIYAVLVGTGGLAFTLVFGTTILESFDVIWLLGSTMIYAGIAPLPALVFAIAYPFYAREFLPARIESVTAFTSRLTTGYQRVQATVVTFAVTYVVVVIGLSVGIIPIEIIDPAIPTLRQSLEFGLILSLPTAWLPAALFTAYALGAGLLEQPALDTDTDADTTGGDGQ
ncbi:hypothetical protein [Natronosalvus amylolyticus]|uniref:hypothetical protein n=1 Tax=Natronosalvus amylolyticus TaxID=2961994 RepID=UPI0020C98FFB|nr:hypothetical protein [Natronosalvus amylolyticus]